MALADDLLPVLYGARAILGQLGFRPHSVVIVRRSFSGDYQGEGVEALTETPLVEGDNQNPKVRWLDGEEAMVGGLEPGTVEIGPITPGYADGGTALSVLQPSLEQGESLLVRITGPKHPNGALYTVVNVQADRALRYVMRCKPRAEM